MKIRKALAFVGAVTAVAAATYGYIHYNEQLTLATTNRDCDNNAIMYCGALDTKELQSKYVSNKTGDIADVYAHYDLSKEDISSSSVEIGKVYRDGTITVGKEKVASKATVVGRLNAPESNATLVKGTTYYERPISAMLHESAASVYVFRDADGSFKGAVMARDGSPLGAQEATTTRLTCDGIGVKKITDDTVIITPSITVEDATLNALTYTISKDDTVVDTIKKTDTSSMTYQRNAPGDYEVKASVVAQAGAQQLSTQPDECSQTFSLTNSETAPIDTARYECTKLTSSSVSERSATFATLTTVKGDATPLTVRYDFGDGKSAETAYGEDVIHDFATSGTYTVRAYATFRANGITVDDITSEQCHTQVVVSQASSPATTAPASTDQPDRVQATTPPPATQPVASATAQPEKPLPSTGPGETIAGAVALGALTLGALKYFASHRAIVASYRKR